LKFTAWDYGNKMYVNGTRTSIPQMNALQIEKLAEKLKVGTYER